MRISLRVKIGLIIFFTVSFCGGVTAYLVYNSSNSALETSIGNNLSNTGNQSMDKIDRFLYERSVDMQQLAGRRQLQDFLAKPVSQRDPATVAVLESQMEDFKNSSGAWSEVTIVDTQGTLPLSSPSLQELSQILAKQPSILTLFTSAVSGQSGYSDALEVDKNHQPVMVFMAPIHDQSVEGQPIVGIVVGELAWQTNLDILRSIDGSDATLINDKGLSLGDNQPDSQHEVLSLNFSNSAVYKNAIKSDSGFGVSPGLDDPNHLYLTSHVKEKGYLDYHGNNWTLILETPKSLAFAPSHKLAKNIILIFSSILVFLIIVFIIIMDREIIGPLRVLKHAAERLSSGDFSQPAIVASKNEIGDLAKAFNNMTQGLQSSSIRLSEEHARLEASINSLGVGFLMTFLGAEIISYNPALIKILGLKDRLKTAGTERLSVAVFQQKIEDFDLVEAIRDAQTEGKHFSTIKTTSDERIISISGVPIASADKRIIGSVILMEDITDAKIQERSRDEFFSIASHELRTPLTSIKGNAAMIMEYYADSLKDPDLKEMVADIRLSSERLIDIVNDFLDLSRLEQGKIIFNTEEFSIEPVIENVIYEMKAILAHKHLNLTFDKMTLNTLPRVWADKNRTKQIVYNLIGNASKFTENGNINVSATVDQEMIKILVTDTGRGISPESQKLLFHKFQQAGSSILTRDTTRGTGLGLYISKMIIEGMGGNIVLEYSEPGKGSTFSFSLPIATHEIKLARPSATKTKTDTKTGLSVPSDQSDEPPATPQPGDNKQY